MDVSRLGPALLAVCCGHLLAQSDPVEVTTPATVITAARFPESAAEGAVNVTVIDAEQIARSQATNLPELLVLEAGIHTRDLYGNSAAGAAVDLRGFGAAAGQNTLILVDGRRLNDIDLAGVQWSSVPLSAIERIEIVRGSGAVQYGDGATTGVINIITRSPAAAQYGANLRTRLGSFETREAQVGGNFAGQSVGLALGVYDYESDGYRDNNRNETDSAYLDARWMPERWTVSFKAGADSEDLRLPGARLVQPSAGIDELESDRRGTSTPLDFATRDGRRAAVELEHQAPGFDLNLGLGYRDKAQTSYFDFGGFPDYREVDLDVWSFTPRLRVPFGAGGARAALVAGVDVYTWDYALRTSNAQTNIGQPINRVSADQENRAVYLRLTAQLTAATSASGGWRYERQSIDAQDVFDPTAPGAAFGSGAMAGTQTESEQAWELALRHALSPAFALSARAGRGFRFATVDEIYETSALFTREFQFLSPQTSMGYDLGVEYADPTLFARATVFQLDVDDEIHLDPYSTGVGNTNLPPTRRRGLELEARWRPTQSLTAQAAYTYTDAWFREGTLPGSAITQQNVDIAGKTVPLVPEHQVTAQAVWQMTPAWRLTGAARHVSSQFMENDEGNTGVKIPAYSVLDLRLDFLEGPLTLTAAVNNVLDEEYYNYAVRSQFVPDRYNAYPLPERTFWVALQLRLP
ncbi:MAG TPA: TonB-dependent receptor [Burkholderiales bacterium]|nr:TonB-dependent receptor [Burkholderiales bacterium]